MAGEASSWLYSNLLGSILTATPDRRVGCLPPQLLSHVQALFRVPDAVHQRMVEAEERQRRKYRLDVAVLQGRKLPGHPYAILAFPGTTSQASSPSLRSPAVSRHGSEIHLATSPNLTASPSLYDSECNAIQSTGCSITAGDCPNWNESFHFDVGDDVNQRLCVEVVCGETDVPVSPTQRRHRLRSILMGKARTTSKVDLTTGPKSLSINIPIKELEMGRWVDEWYDLRGRGSFGRRDTGAPTIRLRLKLSVSLDMGCVMRSTIINTSKEMMAYSDFPPPPSHCPNFMHNSVLNSYLYMRVGKRPMR